MNSQQLWGVRLMFVALALSALALIASDFWATSGQVGVLGAVFDYLEIRLGEVECGPLQLSVCYAYEVKTRWVLFANAIVFFAGMALCLGLHGASKVTEN